MSNEFELNEQGVPVFGKGDTRRLFVIMAAIEELGNPTLLEITARTGYPKSSVTDALKKIGKGELGVVLEKNESRYSIAGRGPFFKKVTFEKILEMITPT